ncbi:MAG TPA: cytochrome c peroxidase [Flavobacteriales bacterium]|nr:cytochrome c peroxidase [Flavobacteriales bacterium]
MRKTAYLLSICLGLFMLLEACSKDESVYSTNTENPGPTPYNLVIPQGLPAMVIPADNPLTVEGIALGKKLFFDPILSGDNSISCGTCHLQEFGFTDSLRQFSKGIDHIEGTRNSMPLINLGWERNFFWDGGASNLESQVAGPITNPVEMHETLANAVAELNAHPEYPALFKKAFGSEIVNTANVMKAIAQFERTLISGNSRFDKYMQLGIPLTEQELRGRDVFISFFKGDCVHCHVMGSTFTDHEFRNNGLDTFSVDLGRGRITLNPSDNGKFKTPGLRNIAVTAPYMHDGRFATLEEVINHYNNGIQPHPNLDPRLVDTQPGRMSEQDVEDIIAFLHTLTDEEFLTNPAFKKP